MCDVSHHHPYNGSRQRQRSVSVHLHTTSTPTVKSLSALDNTDLHFDQLIQWKRSVEQQLNRVELLKLKEIDDLLGEGHGEADVTFTMTPPPEHLVTLTACSTARIDSITDNLQWDHTSDRHQFDLSSNNVLLCASDRHALIYDHVSWKLILYSPSSSRQSFDWQVNDYGEPCDLTYSPHLRCFLIITYRGVFLWSWPHQMVPLHIDAIKPIAGNRLWTVASTRDQSDVFVLFERGTYIERWDSRSDAASWQRLQR